MQPLITCTIKDGIALIAMDDGKSNVVSPAMIKQLNQALDQAEQANAVVVLTGRSGIFSAGFDLKILKSSVKDAFNMLIGGFKLSRRLLGFPTPVVIACNGHAMAMGAFLLLSGDYRIGTKGDYKIVVNEVEIGLTMPHYAIEICRQRLKPAYYDRCVLLSELQNPTTAIDAGFLDTCVEEQQLMTATMQKAQQYTELDLRAHKGSKQRMRKNVLKLIDRAIRRDALHFVTLGIRRALIKH